MKKTLILVIMMACLLGVVTGCGPSSQSNGEPAQKDYGPPLDISLSSEEAEAYGMHLLLPDNSSLQFYDEDPNYAQTVVNLDDPLTCEVVVHVWYNPGDELALAPVGSEETYIPAMALIHWSGLYADDETVTVEKTYVGGTAAHVATMTKENSYGSFDGTYECTHVLLAMNSGYVEILYEDLGGRYKDLIQQSIDSIRIDEEEIPDFVRATSPEGLQAAGLWEQPWEIDCDSFGIYVNPPTDFIPLKQSEGNFEWIAPDGNTVISAEVTDTSTFGLAEDDLKKLEQGMASTTSGFGGFDYSYGEHNGMYSSRIKYKVETESGEAWINMVTVAPHFSGEAIAVKVIGRSEEGVELPEVINVLRYADGWDNGGALDMEEIAVSPESVENQG